MLQTRVSRRYRGLQRLCKVWPGPHHSDLGQHRSFHFKLWDCNHKVVRKTQKCRDILHVYINVAGVDVVEKRWKRFCFFTAQLSALSSNFLIDFLETIAAKNAYKIGSNGKSRPMNMVLFCFLCFLIHDYNRKVEKLSSIRVTRVRRRQKSRLLYAWHSL